MSESAGCVLGFGAGVVTTGVPGVTPVPPVPPPAGLPPVPPVVGELVPAGVPLDWEVVAAFFFFAFGTGAGANGFFAEPSTLRRRLDAVASVTTGSTALTDAVTSLS